MDKAKNRSYPLDFLKIVATVIIVLHHFQQNTNVLYENSVNFWGSWFYWGYMVELFFLLSGYFMYRYVATIEKGEMTLSSWFAIRAKRLLPMVAISAIGYEICILIYRAITGAVWPYFGELSIWGTVITALGIQEGWAFANPGVNNPVWYVSVLMACYVIFYVLCALSRKLKCSALYFFVAMVLLGIGIQTFGINKPFLTAQVGRGYYSFFFGLLIAAFVNKRGVGRKTVIACVAVLVASVSLFAFPEQAAKEPLVYILTFLVYPAIVLLLETEPVKKVFRHKIWGTLGGITFDVYLWHSPMFPLMYGILALVGVAPDFSGVWTMYLFLIAAWAIGTLSFFFVEKPINKLIDKWSDGARQRNIGAENSENTSV